MASFLQYTTEQLIALNARNRSKYLGGMGVLPGGKRHQEADVTWFDTGAGCLNLVFDVNFSDAEADSRIDEVLAYYREHKISCAWNLSPLCCPSDITERLRAKGLHWEHELLYMYLPLEEFQDRRADPQGFTIELVGAPEPWSLAVCEGFGISGKWQQPVMDVLNRSGSSDGSPYYRYVGYLNGVPVACGALLVDEGVAGVYWVATTEGARGKGCGSAMMRRLLRDAKQQGCHLAMLQSTEEGEPLYRRLGFKELPAREPSFLWFPQ